MSDSAPLEPFVPGPLSSLKPVLTEPVPERLFVCSAEVRPNVAEALRGLFEDGTDLPTDLKDRYAAHLAYCHGLGERFYEAGPSGDFTEILFIFRVESLDDVRDLMAADPFWADGVYENAWFFEWQIHVPLFKSPLPRPPEQTIEVQVELTTPRHLVAAFGTFDQRGAIGWMRDRTARPLLQFSHLYQMRGEGGIGPSGIAWGLGPIPGSGQVLHIFAVPSISAARHVMDSEAMTRWAVFEQFRYFDWKIHYPLRKATPDHRALLKALSGG